MSSSVNQSADSSANQKIRCSWFKRIHAAYVGIGIGIVLFATGGYAYLRISKKAISVKDGEVTINETTTISTTTTTQSNDGDDEIISKENTQDVTSNLKAASDNDGISVADGKNSTIDDSGDVVNEERDNTTITNPKTNVSGDGIAITGSTGSSVSQDNNSSNGDNSPVIEGTGANVTIIYRNNDDLPGYNKNSGFVAPPSDLSKYKKVRNLQKSSLITSSSDDTRITFDKKKIVVLGKLYTSFFNVSYRSRASRFLFELDGSQKAALIQFSLQDLPTGKSNSGAYEVKISADGELLWVGDSKWSQNRQIVSVPLEIPGAKTLTIEVDSNGQTKNRLQFTEAKLLME